MLKAMIGLAFFLMSSCMNALPTATSDANYVCQGSSNSFVSCCSGRGGAQTCASGHLFRSSDGALVCGDGSVSSTFYR